MDRRTPDRPFVVLVPGAGSDPAYWDDLRAELAARGTSSVAVDLPCEDDSAGLDRYADAVVSAIDGRDDAVVVAHSLGAFSAPLACARTPVRLLVLLSPMIPRPGESAGDWWEATGQAAARRADAARHGRPEDEGLESIFYHDLDEQGRERARAWDRDQSGTPFAEPWPLEAWPDVPTAVLAFADDRCFPADFIERTATDRLGVEAGRTPGGHMGMVSRAPELADALLALVEGVTSARR